MKSFIEFIKQASITIKLFILVLCIIADLWCVNAAMNLLNLGDTVLNSVGFATLIVIFYLNIKLIIGIGNSYLNK